MNPHTERIPVKGNYYHNYIMQIMYECSTVAEVVDWVNTHQRFPYMHDQLYYADKTVEAVIISAGNKGEVTTPERSKIWWWLIISVLILFAGLIVGVMMLKATAG